MNPVLTLADLAAWSRPGTSLAVLGHPIKHSISPPMHNAALAELARADARFADWEYFRFEIHPDDLPRALDLLHAKKFRGVNLTVPHKIIAFDRVAEIDPAARPVGAVNTLRWSERGWQGFNTDGYGLAAAVRETLGRDLAGSQVILLGAGGAPVAPPSNASNAAAPPLWIANRTRETLQSLLATLTPVADGVPFGGFMPPTPSADLPSGALVINATSAGLRDTDAPPADLTALPNVAAVYDMIYNPPQTKLLRQAAFLGLPFANGLTMLVHQGAKSLEHWSGVPATQTAPTMLHAARAALGL